MLNLFAKSFKYVVEKSKNHEMEKRTSYLHFIYNIICVSRTHIRSQQDYNGMVLDEYIFDVIFGRIYDVFYLEQETEPVIAET